MEIKARCSKFVSLFCLEYTVKFGDGLAAAYQNFAQFLRLCLVIIIGRIHMYIQINYLLYPFMALIFNEWQKFTIFFHKVDKIASGSSYKTLKLWEIHNFIFMNTSKFVRSALYRRIT